MFKEIPEEIGAEDNRLDSIGETVAQMDVHNIAVGVIHMSDDRAEEALRRYPARFAAIRPVNPNLGMDAVRLIAREHAEGKIKPLVHETLPLAQLHEAYARMGARQVVGKLVLLQP